MLAFGEDSVLGHEPKGEQPQKDEARKLASAMPFLVQDALMGATRPRAFHAGSFSCRYNPRETFLGCGWGLGELLPDLCLGLPRLAHAQEECGVMVGVAGAGWTDSRDGSGCPLGGRWHLDSRRKILRCLVHFWAPKEPRCRRVPYRAHERAEGWEGSGHHGGRSHHSRPLTSGQLRCPQGPHSDPGTPACPRHSLAEIQAVPFPIPGICHCCLHSPDPVHCPRHFHCNFILSKNRLNDVFFFLPKGKSKEAPRQPHFGGWGCPCVFNAVTFCASQDLCFLGTGW